MSAVSELLMNGSVFLKYQGNMGHTCVAPFYLAPEIKTIKNFLCATLAT